MEKGTISICFVQSLLDSVQAHGFDGEELLCQSGISSGLLELPHARVSSAT